jgi:hypothetical protein
MRNAYKILGRKPVGEKPLGRLARRWEEDVGMDFNEMGWWV